MGVDDWEKHDDLESFEERARWARLARITLEEIGRMVIPDDATPEELIMLVETNYFARLPASRPIWRRFWQRERAGKQLPSELRMIAAGRSEAEKELHEQRLEEVRRMRRVLEEWGVAVPDDAAPQDLLFLLRQHRPLEQLLWYRNLVQETRGIRLPDDATAEEHSKVLELLPQRLGPARIPKLFFWRRFWPRMRRDLLDEVRGRRAPDEETGGEP